MVTRPKRPYRKLCASDYDSICSIYETGSSTLKEISQKYGISIGSILNQAKARGVSRRGTFPATTTLASASKASAALVIPSTTASATAAEKIRATNDDAYNDAVAIQHLIRASIGALQCPTTAQEAAATVRAADLAVTALDRCNRIRRAVLRLDKENHQADLVLPDLPIYEMTNLECEAMRAEQEAEDRQHGIGGADTSPALSDDDPAYDSADAEIVDTAS